MYHLERFENACLEHFAFSPLVANRYGSLYPGTTVLGVLRALRNFANTKINSAELFACEMTFLRMSVNCKPQAVKKSYLWAVY